MPVSKGTYNIKPKETLYKGILFRSRLEARWAVVFDNINMKWEYEPQTYIGLDGVSYNVDFYFPELDLYAEVKPGDEQLHDEEMQRKISSAIDCAATPVSKGLLLLGPIPYSDTMKQGCFIIGDMLYYDDQADAIGLQTFFVGTMCDEKDGSATGTAIQPKMSFKGEKPVETSKFPVIPEKSTVMMYLDDGVWDDSPSALFGGLILARQARFDFNDSVKKMLTEHRCVIGGDKKDDRPIDEPDCDWTDGLYKNQTLMDALGKIDSLDNENLFNLLSVDLQMHGLFPEEIDQSIQPTDKSKEILDAVSAAENRRQKKYFHNEIFIRCLKKFGLYDANFTELAEFLKGGNE